MIWLSWRQFRTQAVVVFGALAVVAIVALFTGLHMRHAYDASGMSTCAATGDCASVTGAFLASYNVLQQILASTLLGLPVILGIFWGAPLVARELDSGTYRLVWTQSITRRRWLAAKVGVQGLAAVIATGLLSLIVTWWFVPIDRITANRFTLAPFTERNLTPLGYAAFAFALGVTAGLLIRRTLPAMAVTLVGYIAITIAFSQWLRPRLRPLVHAGGPLTPPRGPDAGGGDPADSLIHRGDWIVNSYIIDPSGHPTQTIRIDPDSSCVAARSCLAHYRVAVTFQPANRYWPFQIAETAVFLGLAVALIGLCFWWIQHRVA